MFKLFFYTTFLLFPLLHASERTPNELRLIDYLTDSNSSPSYQISTLIEGQNSPNSHQKSKEILDDLTKKLQEANKKMRSLKHPPAPLSKIEIKVKEVASVQNIETIPPSRNCCREKLSFCICVGFLGIVVVSIGVYTYFTIYED